MSPGARRALALAAVAGWGASCAADLAPPEYGDAFWRHWGDGRGELAGYELTYERYGETRTGTAVTIFVTEPFSESRRVKSDAALGDDRVEMLKLNLIQDFPTGVYDYNMMTSVFVALEPRAGLEAGRAAKISFSSQEWCGHVYAQGWFDGERLLVDSHSYFDGEGDARRELEPGADAIPAEALFLWARGLASPAMAPGERRRVTLLRSLEEVRLRHVPLEAREVELRRGARLETVDVPAGRFATRRHDVIAAPGPDPVWSFWVEEAPPHRLIRWQHAGTSRAELLGSERSAYWDRNGGAFAEALEKLGLQPRPPRTP